jgi:hypothetical protein
MSDAVTPTRSFASDEIHKIPKLSLSGIHKTELPRFSARTTAESASPNDYWWKQQTQSAREPAMAGREGVKEGVIYTVLFPKYREGPQMEPPISSTPQRRRASANRALAERMMTSHGAGMNPDGTNSGFPSDPFSPIKQTSCSFRRRESFGSAGKDILRGGTDARQRTLDPFRKKHEALATKISETESPGMEHAGCCDYGIVSWTDPVLHQQLAVGIWRDGTAAVTWSGPPVDSPKPTTHPSFRPSHFDRAARRPPDKEAERRRRKMAAAIDAQDALQRRQITKTPGCCPNLMTMADSLGEVSTHASFGQSSKKSSKQGSITFSLPATATKHQLQRSL